VLELVKQGTVTGERYAKYMEILAEVEMEQAESRLKGWKN
jgi:putative ribosome biogenesis GTPase RsgA